MVKGFVLSPSGSSKDYEAKIWFETNKILLSVSIENINFAVVWLVGVLKFFKALITLNKLLLHKILHKANILYIYYLGHDTSV